MDQSKTGKFIAEERERKNYTQRQLADLLGISDKTISKWERGNGFPEVSLLLPLCDELEITINELISGEKIDKQVYQEKFEENIINTIDYTSKKIKEKNNLIGMMFIIFGLLLAITAMIIFPSESSWGSIYSILGSIISLIGISKFTKKLTYGKRLVCNFGYFILFTFMLFLLDYLSVVSIKQAPRFSTYKVTAEKTIYYDTPFYDVVRCNIDSQDEYYKILKNKDYSEDNIVKYCKNND